MKVSLSPNIILCGWLGLKHQLTNKQFSVPSSSFYVCYFSLCGLEKAYRQKFRTLFCIVCFLKKPPKGGRGCLISPPLSGISGLSFDSILLSPVLFFFLVLLLFLSFSTCWSILLNFFQKILQYFLLRDRLFLYGSFYAAGRSKLVSGMCSMLPYGTGICCYAFI